MRARIGDIASVGELIDPSVWLRTGERHETVRSGSRQPIEHHVRSAIWLRDRGRCELCGWETVKEEWHLDHITPWSAGGSDRSENLRVLCASHNVRRSNHRDVLERPRRPVTWWCVNCYGHDAVWHYNEESGVTCGLHGYRFCHVRRIYNFAHEETGRWPTWHQRRPVEEPAVVAFCAHCSMPAATDVTL